MNSRCSIEEIPQKDLLISLVALLERQKISKDTMLGLVAVLKKDRMLMAQFIVWGYEAEPTEEEMLHWLVEHT